MAGFAVGHRVVVKPDNGYDKPEKSDVFGLMAGHYGKVVDVTPLTGGAAEYAPGETAVITVHVLGRVGGPANPYVMEEGTLDESGLRRGTSIPAHWLFFPDELEHAD